MSRRSAPFKVRLIGSDRHPRYVIRDARRLAEMFWTGRGWSRRIRDARLFADFDEVNRKIDRLTRRHLRRHEPKRIYLLNVVVRVHADESVSRADVGAYLKDALVVVVDHKRCGTGPSKNSLVEVSVPAMSLEGD